jgi:hypothetical protein
VGLVVIEHKTWLLEGLCHRVGVLVAGRLVTVGPATDVLRDPDLLDYGVEPPPLRRLQAAAAMAGVSLPQPPSNGFGVPVP